MPTTVVACGWPVMTERRRGCVVVSRDAVDEAVSPLTTAEVVAAQQALVMR
jgi:hypothetical protein